MRRIIALLKQLANVPPPKDVEKARDEFMRKVKECQKRSG
jgi:hypothetical protein